MKYLNLLTHEDMLRVEPDGVEYEEQTRFTWRATLRLLAEDGTKYLFDMVCRQEHMDPLTAKCYPPENYVEMPYTQFDPFARHVIRVDWGEGNADAAILEMLKQANMELVLPDRSKS